MSRWVIEGVSNRSLSITMPQPLEVPCHHLWQHSEAQHAHHVQPRVPHGGRQAAGQLQRVDEAGEDEAGGHRSKGGGRHEASEADLREEDGSGSGTDHLERGEGGRKGGWQGKRGTVGFSGLHKRLPAVVRRCDRPQDGNFPPVECRKPGVLLSEKKILHS